MSRSLQGLRILNTRPKKQGQKLADLITKAGGISIDCPSIEIQASPYDWMDTLPDLYSVDQAIFISANAVDYFFQQFQSQAKIWPEQINVIAIGDASAQALNAYGISAHHIPAMADSEHLLALPCLQSLNEQSILLVKGEGGRPLIEQELLKKKAQVLALPVYQRILPTLPLGFTHSLWRDDAVDIILLTSEQSMHHLFALFSPDAHAWLRSKPCFVISERLAHIATSLGINKVRVSPPDSIINSLLDYKD